MKTSKQNILHVAFFLFTSSVALADGVNVDFESFGGVPDESYGALGSVGHWNAIALSEAAPTIELGPILPLLDLNGNESPITMQVFSQAGGSWRLTDPGLEGGHRDLLSDFWSTPDVPMDVTVRNLPVGDYQVTVYGEFGMSTTSPLTAVFGDLDGTLGGDTWKGSFIDGVTHLQSVVNSPDGEIRFSWAAAEFGGFASISGFQIAAVDDRLACDFTGATGCDIEDLDALYAGTNGAPTLSTSTIADWLTQASAADNLLKADPAHVYVIGDVNLDGSVNSTDLGLLLNNFGSNGELNWGDGNLNPGMAVNSADLGLLLNNFGAASAASSVAVPEPDGSIWWLFMACALLRFARRK